MKILLKLHEAFKRSCFWKCLSHTFLTICVLSLSLLGACGSDSTTIIIEEVLLNSFSVPNDDVDSARVGIFVQSNANTLRFLNIVGDINGDGQFASYTLAPENAQVLEGESSIQTEELVKNTPIIANEFGVGYAFYYFLSDPKVGAGSNIAIRAILTEDEVSPEGEWDGTIPAGAISFEDTVTLNNIDTELLVEPGDGLIGSGSVTFVEATDGNKFQEENTAALDPTDVIFDNFGLRIGMANEIRQEKNDCAPSAIGVSLAWLARNHGFEDKFAGQDLSTTKGVRALADDLASSYTQQGLGEFPGDKTKGTGGVSPLDVKKGKDQFVSDKGLPVKTESKFTDVILPDGQPSQISQGDIFNEVKTRFGNGEAVEVATTTCDKAGKPKGSHIVAVGGYSEIKGKKTLYVVDSATGSMERSQGDVGNNRSFDTWTLNDAGEVTGGTFFLRFHDVLGEKVKLTGIVSETIDPSLLAPPEEPMSDPCEGMDPEKYKVEDGKCVPR